MKNKRPIPQNTQDTIAQDTQNSISQDAQDTISQDKQHTLSQDTQHSFKNKRDTITRIPCSIESSHTRFIQTQRRHDQ